MPTGRIHVYLLATALSFTFSFTPCGRSSLRAAEDPLFIRGDVNGSGALDVTDPIALLHFLLLGAEDGARCMDAADADDGGRVNISDAVLILDRLFLGGVELPPPSFECGGDPTPDPLDCADEGACEPDDDDLLGAAAPGLDARPPNDTCTALDRPPAGTGIALQQVFPNLPLIGILDMHQAPGNSSKWYIVRKPGYIYSFTNQSSVATKATVLNMSSRVKSTDEGGLLSMAFHPSFASNGQVFFYYTGPSTTSPLTVHISRFLSRDGGVTIDSSSEVKLLSVDQKTLFHHGGAVGFGLDGYLYISLGESGLQAASQDKNDLRGKMLRIDVNRGTPYGIPSDNPFAGGGGRPEVYAWGLRQPYRWSFDRVTGDLWLADVGNVEWEELDRIERGKNYGWPIREGAHCFQTANCNTSGLTDPVFEYSHADGNCIIGGFVYRGTAIPELQGIYVYGDWGNGRIWGLFYDSSQRPAPRILAESGGKILGFGQGHDGEILISEGTKLYKLVPASGPPSPGTFPERLSLTGYVDPSNPRLPAPCMIPYDINVPFWSDGAAKERWLAIPDGTTIHVLPDGDWELPVGTVFMKNFHLNGKLIETRLFLRHDDGEWGGYTYEWDDAETDATLLPDSKTETIGTTPWTYPSRAQCLQCHSAAAGRALGPEISQMNRDFTYPSTGRTANQLATFADIGMFDAPLPGAPDTLPALPRSTDSGQPLGARARAYLHSNCSHCHRPEGPGRGPADLRYGTPEADMGICDVVPAVGDLGIPGARILAPADPAKSILSVRMHATNGDRMPPIARNLVDTTGSSLIDAWITSVTECPGGSSEPQHTVVLDNGQPGTSFTGNWSVSGAPQFFGASSVYSKSAGATFTYKVNLPASGKYDVFAWWTQWPSRLTNVPIDVVHSGGSATVTVNQQGNGGQWNQLGSWTFGSQATITVRSLGGGSTCADAVCLVPAEPLPPPPVSEIILDNGQAGTTPTGGWSVSGGPNPYGANSLYSKIAGSTYRYRITTPAAGEYDVYAWWTQWPSRAANVPIDIIHSGGTATVIVNQQANGGQWNRLGSWSFGTLATVTVRYPGTGTACADAVRLVPR